MGFLYFVCTNNETKKANEEENKKKINYLYNQKPRKRYKLYFTY